MILGTFLFVHTPLFSDHHHATEHTRSSNYSKKRLMDKLVIFLADKEEPLLEHPDFKNWQDFRRLVILHISYTTNRADQVMVL